MTMVAVRVPAGDAQARPSRPRPAVCCRVWTTCPCARLPRWASAQVLVLLQVGSSTSHDGLPVPRLSPADDLEVVEAPIAAGEVEAELAAGEHTGPGDGGEIAAVEGDEEVAAAA